MSPARFLIGLQLLTRQAQLTSITPLAKASRKLHQIAAKHRGLLKMQTQTQDPHPNPVEAQ